MKLVNAYSFFLLGVYVHPLTVIEKGMPFALPRRVLADSFHQLQAFVNGDFEKRQLPTSIEKANIMLGFLADVFERSKKSGYQAFTSDDVSNFRTIVLEFETVLDKELRDSPLLCVLPKGNLSIDSLLDGASKGYASSALPMLDSVIRREIDESGTCLAYARGTACGFHILRAVEITLKAYVLAATGTLPKMSQRNWGEYIKQAETAQASVTLVDFLKILKTKRNPLMHPQDTLEVDEAISIFSICQAAIEAITSDVTTRNLALEFSFALKALPTL